MPVVGIISDTHGLLRPEALSALQGVDRIVHAGDIGRPDILPALERIAPVTAIRGNVDRADWARGLLDTARLDWMGRRFFVIHDRHDLRSDPVGEGFDVVISGHSHRAGLETIDGVLYLNPGSAGPRRFDLPVTLATLHVEGDALHPTIRRIA